MPTQYPSALDTDADLEYGDSSLKSETLSNVHEAIRELERARKGGYSALVFKDGSDVVAVDSQGVEISRGTDAAGIIADAKAQTGGPVWVQPDVYTTAQPRNEGFVSGPRAERGRPLDLSLTNYRYVNLTIDEIFNQVTWVADHRNPVMDKDIWPSSDMNGHWGGAPDPRMVGDTLAVFSEGFSAKVSGEDIHLGHFDSDGLSVRAPGYYIGNGDDAGRRVAPRVFWVPEEGAYVMFHASYASGSSWSWNYGVSTSTDLETWTRITGADPILEDVHPHTGIVRLDDTFYIIGLDHNEHGYRTVDVSDLTTISSRTDIDLPNHPGGGLTLSLTRAKDGWLLVDSDNGWGDLLAWETSFADFPEGWSEVSGNPNPFGFEKNASWSSEGHRNVCIIEAGGVPMVVAPGTDNATSTSQSRTGFFRANTPSNHRYHRVPLPSILNPDTDQTTTSTTYTAITSPLTGLHIDGTSLESVFVKGRVKVENDTSGETTSLRLRDTTDNQDLFEFQGPGGQIIREGPYNIRRGKRLCNALELQMKVSDGTGTYNAYGTELYLTVRQGREVIG